MNELSATGIMHSKQNPYIVIYKSDIGTYYITRRRKCHRSASIHKLSAMYTPFHKPMFQSLFIGSDGIDKNNIDFTAVVCQHFILDLVNLFR